MDGSTRGFPVLHHLLKFAQTQVLGVGDANQETVLKPGLAMLVFRFGNLKVMLFTPEMQCSKQTENVRAPRLTPGKGL